MRWMAWCCCLKNNEHGEYESRINEMTFKFKHIYIYSKRMFRVQFELKCYEMYDRFY